MAQRTLSAAPRRVGRLSPAEREVLDCFANIGKYPSLPRSVGEIYGLLFARGEKPWMIWSSNWP